MASIGVRFDNSSSGADLATMLAKAMYGSPMDRYNAANIMSEIENRGADTEYRRALTAYQNAKGNREQEIQNAQYRRGIAMGGLGFRTQEAGQPEAPVVVTEQPVPGAAAAAPAPVPVTEPPVPIATREPIPAMFGQDQPLPAPGAVEWRPTRPGQQTSGPQPAPPPLPVRPGQDVSGLPPQVLPVRPGQQVSGPQPEPPAVVGEGPEPDFRISTYPFAPGHPATASGLPEPTWGQKLTSLIGLNNTMGVPAPDAPVAVDDRQITIPGRTGPVAPIQGPYTAGVPQQGPNLPPPQQLPAHPHESTPEAPVSVEQLPAHPHESTPMQPGGPTQVQQPAPPSTVLPIDTSPQAIAANAAAAAAQTPQQKQQASVVAATQPPAAVQPGQVANHGDGTVSVGLSTGPRRMSLQEWQDVMVADAFSTDAAGQTQADMGTIQMMSDPRFGKDHDFTLRALTLANKGTTPTRESAYGAPAGAGGYLGTGVDAQDVNTITNVTTAILGGGKPTPEQAIQYAQAYDRNWGQPKWHREIDPTSKDPNNPDYIDVPYTPAPPQGVRTPAEVYAAAGMQPPAGTTVVGGAAAAPAAGGAAVPATGATVAAGTPATAGAGQRPPGAVTVKSGTTPQPTEVVLANRGFAENAKLGDADLKTLDLKGVPSSWTSFLTDPTIGGGGGDRVTAGVNAIINAASSSPEIKRFWGATQSFASPILRKESGAATRPEDMATIMQRYIPLSDDPPDVVQLKALRREVAIDGLDRAAYQVDQKADDATKLAEVNAYVDTQIARMKQIKESIPPPAATPASKTPAAAAPATPKTPADFDALHKGDHYIDPGDGKEYIK